MAEEIDAEFPDELVHFLNFLSTLRSQTASRCSGDVVAKGDADSKREYTKLSILH